jgi:hypothetical protein
MAVAAMAGSSVDYVCSDIESSHHIAVNTEQNPEISFNKHRTDRMSSDSGQTPDDVCTQRGLERIELERLPLSTDRLFLLRPECVEFFPEGFSGL